MEQDTTTTPRQKVDILSQSISIILKACTNLCDFLNILRELEVLCSVISSTVSIKVKMIYTRLWWHN